ncbi:LPS export ABC transporter periplasmic protein LptC [Candidatus Pseudothioglobus sp. Uisw_086]|uniref:LPS export ABC transporter periplasmic protein LptC n=1 Tax=Candidatus Pseudothioglobus sp. Uisw_086 TaxID=3230998 RepID=UPI003A88BC08
MALFQTKKIQSFIVFIIVLATILWVFQDNFLKFLIFQKNIEQSVFSSEKVKDSVYLEKIDNFFLKEYSKEQVLMHTIKAENYYSYKNSPIELLEVEVTTYNPSRQKGLMLTSNRAEMFKSGEMLLNGDVKIQTKSGISHELNTESLKILTSSGEINSNKKVTYLGETSRIISEGMEMSIDGETMLLKGNVEILEDSGSTIDTTNLFINHTAGEKIYSSKEKTVYRSKDNIISSDNGVDINMSLKLMKLLGEVEIVNVSGSILKSSDLIIDQSYGGEILKSNSSSHFKSNIVDIKAKKMHYDAVTKKLELTNRVLAVYE